MSIELTIVLMVTFLSSVKCLLRGTFSPLKAPTILGLTLLRSPGFLPPPAGLVQHETVRQLTLGTRRRV